MSSPSCRVAYALVVLALRCDAQAELVRQRNREHARAARRRKKRYVEQLQQQVTELLQQQNSTDAGRPNTTAAEASGTPRKDLSGVRRATLQRFLTYRTSQGRGHVVTEAEWRRVIDDNFSLSQPWTPLRVSSPTLDSNLVPTPTCPLPAPRYLTTTPDRSSIASLPIALALSTVAHSLYLCHPCHVMVHCFSAPLLPCSRSRPLRTSSTRRSRGGASTPSSRTPRLSRPS